MGTDVVKVTPIIATQASAGNVIGTGSVTDTATVSGVNPSRTVTFRLFSDLSCSNQVFTSTNALTGGTATSGPATPPTPGTYFWTARYDGDAANTPAVSPCQAPNESVTILKASPRLTTTASAGNLVGAPVRDMASLAGGLIPTGSVTSRLFSDAGCATEGFNSTIAVSGATGTSGW